MRPRQLSVGPRTIAIAVVLLAGVCAPGLAEGQARRTVLAIQWGSESDPSTERLDAAIRGALLARPDERIDYFSEYLETEDFPAETASNALQDYIRQKFEGRHIDVVIAVASASLQFALQYRDALFPGAPIVFLAVALPSAVVTRTVPGITGLVNDTPFGETLDLALKLHPTTKQVFVVAQAPAVDGYDERVRSALRQFTDRVNLVYIKEQTVPALLAAVKAIPPQSLLLYTRYAPTQPVPNLYTNDVAHLIAAVAPVPMYGVSDLYIGSGVVGGMIRAADAAGTRVGEIALEILNGTSPENIPIDAVSTVPMFDWREVSRWGIDTSKIPPESRILFRTPSAWESYRWYIVGTIVVVTMQLLLITGLVTHRARRRRAEGALRAQEASLRTSYERIRLLAGRLINAQEAARASIAQDLHDDVCQRLAFVSMAIDRLTGSSGDIQRPAAQRSLKELAHETRSTFDSIRQLSHDLHPATLRVLGLASALKTHCSEVAIRHKVEVTFTSEGDLGSISRDVAICFFRIAQESLRNGIIHGEASELSVSLAKSGEDLVMIVTDNGRGFDIDKVRQHGSAFGLVSMEERARVVGADVQIITGLRLGTTIHVRGPAVAHAAVPGSETTVERSTESASVKSVVPVAAAIRPN
jgi:signal transduction histidine kinase